MPNFKQKAKNKYEICAMANLSPATTGVQGAIIWVSVGEFEGKKSQHSARIKVVEGTTMTAEGLKQCAIITISNTPELLQGKLKRKIIKDVFNFIKINKNTLLKYWNGKIDTSDLINNLRSI